jgi:hypothetical protein
MRKLFFLCLLALLLLAPGDVCGQVKVPANPPGDDVIVPLSAGEKAPFSGQLFDTDTSIRWGNWLQQYQLRLEYEASTQAAINKARQDYYDKSLVVERDKYEKVTQQQRDTIVHLEKELADSPRWYESFTFGLVVGVVATSAIFGLSVWAVSASGS